MNFLNLPKWEAASVEESANDYRVEAAYSETPTYCPRCRRPFPKLYRHGTREQLLMDLPSRGKRAGIVLDRVRFRCRECEQTFLQPLPDVDEGRQMTRRLMRYIEEQSIARTFTAVAGDVGVDEKTVRNLFRAYIERLDNTTVFDTPEWMGMDEVHLLKKPRAVFTNIKERTMGMRNGKQRASRTETPLEPGTDDEARTTAGLTVASFFAGIGGFDIGFEFSGFRTVFQCEIDEFCTKILKKHWPKVPRVADIEDIHDVTAIPAASVWTGGFPCQDVSLAQMRKRVGLRGKRSGLFHKFARLIEQGCPRVLLIENVPGLLSCSGGRDFQIVVRTLAQFGYGVGWRVLNSKNFGVPQLRQRVFLVGTYRDRTGPAKILFEPECGQGDPAANGSHGAKTIPPSKRGPGETGEASGPDGAVVKPLAYCL